MSGRQQGPGRGREIHAAAAAGAAARSSGAVTATGAATTPASRQPQYHVPHHGRPVPPPMSAPDRTEATQVVRVPPGPDNSVDLFTLLGGGEPARYDLDQVWRDRDREDLYRLPIGHDVTGCPLQLDFKKSGYGVGVFGAAESGKSELLRSLVLGLAAAHPLATSPAGGVITWCSSTTGRHSGGLPPAAARCSGTPWRWQLPAVKNVHRVVRPIEWW